MARLPSSRSVLVYKFLVCSWAVYELWIIIFPNCWHTHAEIVFTVQPSDVEIDCGMNIAMFHCQYEGSTAHPRWIINSSTYPSFNSQLPRNHFYADHILTVESIVQSQNNTLYQCELLSTNNEQICSYKSTIGRLVVNCKGNYIKRECNGIFTHVGTGWLLKFVG